MPLPPCATGGELVQEEVFLGGGLLILITDFTDSPLLMYHHVMWEFCLQEFPDPQSSGACRRLAGGRRGQVVSLPEVPCAAVRRSNLLIFKWKA